jgi:transcriptional regulator with XRE-family HTH domain
MGTLAAFCPVRVDKAPVRVDKAPMRVDSEPVRMDRERDEISPTGARRHLRLVLREARESAGLTQLEVAEQMEWSLSKVIRIENGDVRISPNDLRPLLTLLQVTDRTAVADLLAYARIARTRQRTAWYQLPEFREHLTEPLIRLIEYEAEAEEIRYLHTLFVPGPLQTIAYATATLETHDDEDIPAMTRRARAEARRRRGETMLARLGSLRVEAVLDETVFRRLVGGEAVLAEQIRLMLDLAVAGRITVRMIPFDSAASMTNNATFDLLTLKAGDPNSDVLYREAGLLDEIVEGRASTARHRSRFDKVWQAAATEADTIDFMRTRIKELEAQIRDRSS